MIESSSPVTLNSAVFRGTVTLAGMSRRAPAIFSTRRFAASVLVRDLEYETTRNRSPRSNLGDAKVRELDLSPDHRHRVLIRKTVAIPHSERQRYAPLGGGEGQAYLFYARLAHQRFALSSCHCS
jgi:hypothetical protein